MIKSSHVTDIKRERRKSFFFREMTALIRELAERESAVMDVFVSHVDISPNSGTCYVYFSSFKEPGEEVFRAVEPILRLYKPSLRTAFAKRVQTRYAPDLVFLYDKAKEKERRVNDLLNKVQDDFVTTEPSDDTDTDKE
jgi:ribosome-binding factor A